MRISLRNFRKEDIPFKVTWINDRENNKYLHYDLPLREDKTLQWFKTLDSRKDRADYTIIYNTKPAGLIGLLNLDLKMKEAEYYVCLGGDEYKGKGIASTATDLLIKKSHQEYGLNNIYLYTEIKNMQAQKMFEKIGFEREPQIDNDLFYNGKYIERYKYNLDVEKYMQYVGGM